MKFKSFFLLTLLLILIGCNEGKEDVKEDTPNAEEAFSILTYFDSHKNEVQSLIKDSLTAIYQMDNIRFYWITDDGLNDEGLEFYKIIEQPELWGIPRSILNTDTIVATFTKYQNTKDPMDLIKSEFLISSKVPQIAYILKRGFLKEDTKETKLTKDSLNRVDWQYIFNSEEPYQALLGFHPQNVHYQLLLQSFMEFQNAQIISDSVIEVISYKKDSIQSYAQAGKALKKIGMLQEGFTDSNLIDAIKKFQLIHEMKSDGVIGRYTAEQLSLSSMDIFLEAVMCLEKWRWLPEWNEHHIFANIPEYKIKIVDNNKIVLENRSVVGTVYNKTPEIEGELEYFQVNPFWYVPYSITANELIPKAKKDPTYLSRNNYIVSGGGDNIDWNTVEASSISIKQKSGKYNALGKVKFIFPNESSIYFHDTPSKSLFQNDRRAYSHGCVRVHEPFEIADYLIENSGNEKWMAEFDSIKKTDDLKTYTLPEKIPVHIAYFTASGDTENHLKTHYDIYERNTELRKVVSDYFSYLKN